MSARRRLALALLTLGLHAVARAEAPAFTDDPGLVVPLATGVRGLVLLGDGKAVEGRVVRLLDGAALVRIDPRAHVRDTPPATVRSIPLDRIRGFVPLVAPSGAEGGVRLVLEDGSVVGGRLAGSSEEGLLLEGPGGRRTFAAGQVRGVYELEPGDALPERRVRHLEVPSADLLAPGSVRLAALGGIHLVGAAGVLDHLVIEAGTALPLLHAEGLAANAQVAVRAAFSPLPFLSVAGGAHLEATRPDGYAGRLSATATATLPRVSLTLHAGPTFAGATGLARLGPVSLAAAATVRLTRQLELVGEAWTSRPSGQRLGLAALRVGFSRLSLDAGVTGSGEGVGPWFGLALDLGR
ncbi:MAG: hypothetical protein U0229_10765 [Anaeromyxobacter sp.]